SPTSANLVRHDNLHSQVTLINLGLSVLIGKSQLVQLEVKKVGYFGEYLVQLTLDNSLLRPTNLFFESLVCITSNSEGDAFGQSDLGYRHSMCHEDVIQIHLLVVDEGRILNASLHRLHFE